MSDAGRATGATILCVDDEPNILSALRRAFRVGGYRILTANGGAEALQLLETEPVDLIISDMRMPGMDGAQFLEKARARWPDTVRMLLTGHADVQTILDAINKGEISRYITKPWDDNDIQLLVRHALERRALEQETRRLEALTQQQNQELKSLNASLESKVAERTASLQEANAALTGLNQKLKDNFLTSIKIFANLIELRAAHLAGHSRRVADLARRIAARMVRDPLDTAEIQEVHEIFIAGLLHNIGKVGFSDELLAMPVNLMNGETLGRYRKYPVRGQELLMPLEDMTTVARIIRSQQERFDGEGYPDRLSGFDIPLGARILALAADYENLQNGTLHQRHLRPDEALALVLQGRGKRYDPAVVDAFQAAVSVGSNVVEETRTEIELAISALRPGMRMARDLVAPDGLLLLSANHVLDERLIRQIAGFERANGMPMPVWVRAEAVAAS